MLSKQDRQKLFDAGYTFIRAEYPSTDRLGRIKQLNSRQSGYTTLEGNLPTKAEVNRRLKAILKNPLTIQD